jgi:RNA polymerase sigma-70 factor (ECF subfamily)
MKSQHSSETHRELEPENLSILFRGDYNRIFRYILSMVRNKEEAEDLTQETFLKAYRKLDSLREAGAQTTWLYRIATHTCLDRLRQYTRFSSHETDADLDQVDIAEPDSPSLQKVIEQDEMSACVQNYLNRLSDSYRAVIMLHDMHDLTATEISDLLGESLPNIKIRLHRARLKLKSALAAGCVFLRDENDVLTCETKP